MRMTLRICLRSLFIMMFVLSWASICHPSNYEIRVDIMTAEEVKTELSWNDSQLATLLDVSVCETYKIQDAGGFQRSVSYSFWYYFRADETLPQLEVWHEYDAQYVFAFFDLFGDAYSNVTGETVEEWGVSSITPEHLLFYGSNVNEGDYVRLYVASAGEGGAPAKVMFHATPIPGAVWLLGSGLIGIVGIRRKFRK